MMSETSLTFGVATPSLSSAVQSAARSRCATCGSTRFCSCPTRISPKLIAVGEVGDRIHLLGGGVAGRPAFRLQRQRDNRIA